MIESIYTGITGIESHQTRMNVIGNNIANVNTNGFKSGRVTFADVMSHTLSEGSAPRDGVAATNPRQSGLGVRVGSIDVNMSQGSLQSTGIDTDLAIEGEGFFVVRNGQQTAYTRDGSFTFAPEPKTPPSGKLVLIDPATGAVVQGNLPDPAKPGALNSQTEDLVVDPSKQSAAKATTQIHLSGNLDASGEGQGVPAWTADTVFGTPAKTASFKPNLILSAPTIPTGAFLNIKVTQGGASASGQLILPHSDFATEEDLATALNAQINNDDELRGKVLFSVSSAGLLTLRTTAGGAGVSLDLTGNGGTALGLVPPALPQTFAGGAATTGATTAGATTGATLLNDLANVGKDLSDGDRLRFSGIKPTGERFEGALTIQPGGSNLKDLLDAIVSAYGDSVTASLDPAGKIVLNDSRGDQVNGFSIDISLLDNISAPPPGGGAVNQSKSALTSGIIGADSPYSFSTNTQVYDTKGTPHSLTLKFTKSVVANEWTWMATVDGTTPKAGYTGKAVFKGDGSLDTFDAADKSSLLFELPGGAPDLSIDLGRSSTNGPAAAGGNTNGPAGLTQFVAPSSASARDQDGRASGSLTEVAIEDNGTIRGLFSNGESQVLGQVELTSFTNPEGLKRAGNNLFMETEASGKATPPQSALAGRIRAGSLEMSNVDLANEFVNMMVTQRGFQASARTITTADELLTELVNLKR